MTPADPDPSQIDTSEQPPASRAVPLGGTIGAGVGALVGAALALGSLGHDLGAARDPLTLIAVLVGAVIIGGGGAIMGAISGGCAGLFLGFLVRRTHAPR